jgi:hypothetical protein
MYLPRFLFKPLTVEDLGAMTPQPPVCDFCGVHAPAFVYASRTMTDGTAIRCWRWAACPDCHQMVESDNWNRLVRQIVERLGTTMPHVPMSVRESAAIRAMGLFFINAIELPEGPRTSFGNGDTRQGP